MARGGRGGIGGGSHSGGGSSFRSGGFSGNSSRGSSFSGSSRGTLFSRPGQSTSGRGRIGGGFSNYGGYNYSSGGKPVPVRPPHIFFGGPSSMGNGRLNQNPLGSGGSFNNTPPYNNPATGNGCRAGCLIALVVLVLIVALSFLFFRPTGLSGTDVSDVTVSSTAREPLPSEYLTDIKTEYHIDDTDYGWDINQSTLESGMKSFQKATGVQPYIYITGNINGNFSPTTQEIDAFAETYYAEMFQDNAHLLIVFFEYDSYYTDSQGYYIAGYVGRQAKQVIDSEAQTIILDYFGLYYDDSSLGDDEYISKVFEKSGERIMTVTQSPWIKVIVILAALAAVIIAFFWWKKKKDQENYEAEQTERILNTPIEKLENVEAEQLAQKYEDPIKTEDPTES